MCSIVGPHMRILAPISNSPTVQVPAAPPAPATPQVGDDATAALQSQVREISRQLSQLSRERQIIGQRLERASGAEASALRMQADALNSEIGNLTGALSESASRLAELKIQQAISNMPPPAFPPMGSTSRYPPS